MLQFIMSRFVLAIGLVASVALPTLAGSSPIPDRLVVLTFDDGNLTDLTHVAPILQRYGFGATFFISEAFQADKQNYMTWEEVRRLSREGFEIGNHSRRHQDVRTLSKKEFAAELEMIENRCKEHGIPLPTTFCYPGYNVGRDAVKVLAEKGYRFARRGCEPLAEFARYDKGGRGPAYDPRRDHPLLIPTTGASGPDWTFEDFIWVTEQAKNGKIAVLTFHGVPDGHFWCSTQPSTFEAYMKYLHEHRFTVIALRDLGRYVDPAHAPSDPFESLHEQLRLAPTELTCEYLSDPLGIDVAQPGLSWKPVSCGRGQVQSAYQILVASSPGNLRRNEGDLWDSGKVVSNQTLNIPYRGKPLVSGQKCWWKVRCWNRLSEDLATAFARTLDRTLVDEMRQEGPGPDSPAATFEMGLLKRSDWKGRWIAADKRIAAPLLRKEFAVAKAVKAARLHVAGLGYHEVYINGRKVGDRVLEPATTLYDKTRLPELHGRVLYATHDVTGQLQTGRNAVGIMLGNGWYSGEKRHRGRVTYGDRPVVLAQVRIEFTDGTEQIVATDDTWKTSSGPIVDNDICDGETYDARLEKPGWHAPGYDDSQWQPAQAAEAPNGDLVAQMLPPARVVQTIPAVKILNPAKGVYVYDFGQHFSGWARLRVRGPRGSTITLRHAGAIHDDGRLDRRSNHAAAQTDVYTLAGRSPEPELWEPRFTLHGFRYVEVTGLTEPPALSDLEGRVVRSAIQSTGAFACSNPLLNRIHQNVRWTLMSSFQGIPQDAADRDERVAWLGDPGFMADSYFLDFDTAAFWTKWLRDIRDTQKRDGDVPIISPLHLGSVDWAYSFLPTWKSSYPLFVWHMYRYQGDKRVLEEHYEGLKRLVALLGTKAKDHILTEGLGDHMEPQEDGHCNFSPRHTPPALTSTAYYYYDTWIVAQAARILGKTDEADRYSRLAEEIRAAFNRKFLNPATNQYATGSQTSNALPLHLGLVPEDRRAAVAKNLADEVLIKHRGHLSTGIIGTNALQQALPDHGLADVMYRIATRTTFPSWGFQIRNGATTVWETFDLDPTRCLNMKMFCSTEKFFFMDLAGVGPAGPGWETIRIRPRPCGDLTFARASVRTPRGLAAVDWRKEDGSFHITAMVPVNTRATVSIPKLGLKDVKVAESGITCWQAGKPAPGICGITGGSEDADSVTLDVGSGQYVLRLTGRADK